MTASAWLVGFSAGSIPFGYLLYRLRTGSDIRERGSGNIGAANVARVLGARSALAVLLLDALKGAAPTFFFVHLAGPEPAAEAALAATLGHVFSPWLGFRGGKGVATAAGAFSVFLPGLALLAAVTFALALVLWRIVAVASLAAVFAFVVAVACLEGRASLRLCALGASALVLLRHRPNLRRLARGEEPRLALAGRMGGR